MPEGAEADDPGTQQRRSLLGAEAVGEGVGIVRGRHHVLRVTAVPVPTGEFRGGAQVLVASAAVAAHRARTGQPRDPHPVSDGEAGNPCTDFVDDADDLVARHHQVPFGRQVAFRQMQVGPTDPADLHPNPNLARRRLGNLAFHERQGMTVDGASRSTAQAFTTAPRSRGSCALLPRLRR